MAFVLIPFFFGQAIGQVEVQGEAGGGTVAGGDSIARKPEKGIRTYSIYVLIPFSWSSNVYGIPRSTKDADFVVELTHAALPEIMRTLGNGYSLDPQMGKYILE